MIVNVVFHSPCKDGFGAAWAFYRSITKGLYREVFGQGAVVKFLPEGHKWDQTKKLLGRDTREELVYFIDICPPRDMLLALHDKSKQVKVIDHHKTAFDDCGDLTDICFFDMNRSGAGLAWDIFCEEPRPYLIDCIEDGDLWRWTVPDSDKVLIVLETQKFTFESFDRFNAELESADGRARIITKGKHYVEYRKKVSSMLLSGKVHKMTFHDINGKAITLPAVNASIFQSGLGNMLSERPGPAAAVYFTRGRGWSFSLRSNDRGPDISEIARNYGGGGHRNASGFRVDSLSDLQTEEMTDEEIARFMEELGFDVLDYIAERTFTIRGDDETATKAQVSDRRDHEPQEVRVR